jgi:hypothetical protein
MVNIKTDQARLRNDFEGTTSFLLPYDPVQKKRNGHGTKRGPADISDATGEEAYANISSFGTKEGNGSSGVPLDTTRKRNMIFLTRPRGRSFVNGEVTSRPKEGRRRAVADRKFDTAEAFKKHRNVLPTFRISLEVYLP